MPGHPCKNRRRSACTLLRLVLPVCLLTSCWPKGSDEAMCSVSERRLELENREKTLIGTVNIIRFPVRNFQTEMTGSDLL